MANIQATMNNVARNDPDAPVYKSVRLISPDRGIESFSNKIARGAYLQARRDEKLGLTSTPVSSKPAATTRGMIH